MHPFEYEFFIFTTTAEVVSRPTWPESRTRSSKLTFFTAETATQPFLFGIQSIAAITFAVARVTVRSSRASPVRAAGEKQPLLQRCSSLAFERRALKTREKLRRRSRLLADRTLFFECTRSANVLSSLSSFSLSFALRVATSSSRPSPTDVKVSWESTRRRATQTDSFRHSDHENRIG